MPTWFHFILPLFELIFVLKVYNNVLFEYIPQQYINAGEEVLLLSLYNL